MNRNKVAAVAGDEGIRKALGRRAPPSIKVYCPSKELKQQIETDAADEFYPSVSSYILSLYLKYRKAKAV